MANAPKKITETELRKLAHLYGIEMNERTVQNLLTQVNARLTAGLELLYEYDISPSVNSLGKRSWTTPGQDEYNALCVTCCVPPTRESGDELTSLEIGLKDNISVAGIPLSCGSSVMEGYVPSTDATVVHHLREAGATITAKTNMDEFAVGGRGKSFRGRIRNPRDPDRSAGGSSGGSAAAVAARYVDAALGTDTGGSVRVPAAFCGLIGLKPTYGLVSLNGVVENTYSLDHVGPISNTISDAARILDAISGKDESDPASMQAAGEDNYQIGEYESACRSPQNSDEIKLAVLSCVQSEPIEEGVQKNHTAAVAKFQDVGITVNEIQFNKLDTLIQTKNTISYCELASHWRDRSVGYRRSVETGNPDTQGFANHISGSAEDMNDFHRSRILAGARLIETYSGQHYTRAHAVKYELTQIFDEFLEDIDAIVTPTVPYIAPLLDGDEDPDALNRDSLGAGRYTKIGNVTGLPAITIPNGTNGGAPVGMQLIGPRFGEDRLLAVAARLEELIESLH